MLAVLVLVALLGVGALQLLNEVRVDQYRERLAQGTFRLMADNLAPMVEIERRRAVTVWGRLLGVPLRIEALDDAGLDSGVRNSLRRGLVAVQQTGPHEARIYSQLAQQPLLLVADVQQVSEQLKSHFGNKVFDTVIPRNVRLAEAPSYGWQSVSPFWAS